MDRTVKVLSCGSKSESSKPDFILLMHAYAEGCRAGGIQGTKARAR